MFEMTHQKARALLQSAADQSIDPDAKTALEAHLAACEACNHYAEGLTDLEVNLRRVLHANWDQQKPDINLQAIIDPKPAKLLWNNLFGRANFMSKVTIAATLLLGYFVIASIFGIKSPISNDETPTILPTPNEAALAFSTSPTPSAAPASTLTDLATRGCDTVNYAVQSVDSLESISREHNISKDLLMQYNHLTSEAVTPGTRLVIPQCEGAPSLTATLSKNNTSTPLIGTLFPTQPE